MFDTRKYEFENFNLQNEKYNKNNQLCDVTRGNVLKQKLETNAKPKVITCKMKHHRPVAIHIKLYQVHITTDETRSLHL